jgi:hypothetical protein
LPFVYDPVRLALLLDRWLDPACSFWSATDPVAPSATSGAMGKKRVVKPGCRTYWFGIAGHCYRAEIAAWPVQRIAACGARGAAKGGRAVVGVSLGKRGDVGAGRQVTSWITRTSDSRALRWSVLQVSLLIPLGEPGWDRTIDLLKKRHPLNDGGCIEGLNQVSVEFRYAAEASEPVSQQHDNVHWTNHNSLSFFLEMADIPEKFEAANK